MWSPAKVLYCATSPHLFPEHYLLPWSCKAPYKVRMEFHSQGKIAARGANLDQECRWGKELKSSFSMLLSQSGWEAPMAAAKQTTVKQITTNDTFNIMCSLAFFGLWLYCFCVFSDWWNWLFPALELMNKSPDPLAASQLPNYMRNTCKTQLWCRQEHETLPVSSSYMERSFWFHFKLILEMQEKAPGCCILFFSIWSISSEKSN